MLRINFYLLLVITAAALTTAFSFKPTVNSTATTEKTTKLPPTAVSSTIQETSAFAATG